MGRVDETAEQFFSRMEKLDHDIAALLDKQHATEVAKINSTREAKEPFQKGDWVWVLRPQDGSANTKAESWWLGPVPVVRRVGQGSYEVMLRPGTPFQTHRDRLKPCVVGKHTKLYHYGPGYRPEGVTTNEWNVAQILDHRLVAGNLEFLTQWEGFEQGPLTWEPVGNFIHRYSYKFPEYCKKKKLQVDLAHYLRDTPTPEDGE